jgi:hypothetical protein
MLRTALITGASRGLEPNRRIPRAQDYDLVLTARGADDRGHSPGALNPPAVG